MRRKHDEFMAWLGSDSDLPFSEWRRQRGARTNVGEDRTVMPLGLTYALVIVAGMVFWVGLGVLLW